MSMRCVNRRIALVMLLGLIMVFNAHGQFVEQQKLTARDGQREDRFGINVSMSGNRLVIGARDDGAGAGSAYVFERPGNGSWQEVAKLRASNRSVLDRFGESVSISGKFIVIGALGEDTNGSQAGAAYVFERQGNGKWKEVAMLTASDGQKGDFFGRGVSIDGNRLAIGASGDGDQGELAGAVYVFERQSNGSWREVSKLTASDGEAREQFGSRVSISGGRLAVGLASDDDDGENSGSVYIFERRSNASWREVVKLTASDAEAGDFFGGGVSLDGGRLAVGAAGDDDQANRAGAVYVFERRGSRRWEEVAKLTASDGQASDGLSSVSLDGNRLVIGAAGDDDRGSFAGAAYVFERSNGVWREVMKVTASDGEANDILAASVSLNKDQFVLGASGEDENGSSSGAAYVFGPGELPPLSCDCRRATLVGTEGDDVLVGRNINDVICGLGGNDRIDGRNGHDCIIGGNGDDVIIGGGGNDELRGGRGDDILLGSSGDDMLDGGNGNDILRGNAGRDDLSGGGGNDRLFGNADSDILSGEEDDDQLSGGSGDDVLLGGKGDDQLNGGNGEDSCSGDAGSDTARNCEATDSIP